MASSTQDNIQVCIQDVSRSFREGDQLHSVLKNLNAEFIRGETVSLKGRSGSGKSTLTVADNIRLVLELNGVPEPEIAERIEELLASIELADRNNSYPDVLSGGEQQRVAIARALAHRPLLLLVDEPTGNLDDKTTEGVLELLARLALDVTNDSF